jgi:hypothetical protein
MAFATSRWARVRACRGLADGPPALDYARARKADPTTDLPRVATAIVEIAAQVATVVTQIAPVAAPIARIRSQLAPILPEFVPVARPSIGTQLASIGADLARVLANLVSILSNLAAIAANLPRVVPDVVLPCDGRRCKRQQEQTRKHPKRLHLNLPSAPLRLQRRRGRLFGSSGKLTL